MNCYPIKTDTLPNGLYVETVFLSCFMSKKREYDTRAYFNNEKISSVLTHSEYDARKKHDEVISLLLTKNDPPTFR